MSDKRSLARHAFKAGSKKIIEPHTVVATCDHSIDKGECDIEAYEKDRTQGFSSLVFLEDQRPVKFYITPLRKHVFKKLRQQAVALSDAGFGVGNTALSSNLLELCFKNGCGQVHDMPMVDEDIEEPTLDDIKYKSMDSSEAMEILPPEFVIDIGTYIMNLTASGGAVKLKEDVGKS